jgi:hypothetical protein
MKAVLRGLFGVAPLLLFHRLQSFLHTVILNHADSGRPCLAYARA